MKTTIIKRLFAISFFFPIIFFAQQTGKISGMVTDQTTGEALIGANIIIDGTSTGASSDLEGFYAIMNVHPGDYTVIASMVGFRRIVVNNVKVVSGKTTSLNFEMEEGTTEISGEVVITATRPVIRKDLTSSELTVSAEDIEKLPVENLNDVLKLKAGVVTDASGGIHIRGGRTSEVGYLIDGISVTDKFSGDRAAAVDVQSMQEVKVISGVFNAEYGQALSGIVDVITKKGSDKFQGNVNISTGDYISGNNDVFYNINDIKPWAINDMKANLSGPFSLLNKRFNYALSFRRYHNEGWLFGKRRFNTFDSSYQVGNSYVIDETGNNEITAMNSSTNLYGQAKLDIDLFQDIKISNLFLTDQSDYQVYNHDFKYNPDGLQEYHNKSYNNIFTLTYIISERAFLTLKHSYGFSERKNYVFENYNDPRYANPELLNKLTSYSFLTGGVQRDNDSRKTYTNIFKGDFLTQLGKFNEFKTGFEFRLDDININNKIALYNGNVPDVFDFNRYQNVGAFNYSPVSFAYYIQDKLEYESVIVNAGVRFDYFNSNWKTPSDLRDPENSTKLDADAQYQVSPRVGIAFPVSADGTLHFSYGHFFKIPDYEFVYKNPNFRVGPGGLQSIIGNANLKAESTVAYELGIHYKFFDIIGLEIVGFYKDITNLLGTEIINTYIGGDRYALYTNRDYGKARGISFSLFKRPSVESPLSVSLDYTVQIAEANASDPNDAFNKSQGDPPKKPNVQIVPVNWDQRHTINISLFYTIADLLSFGIVAKYESGFPYTPENQSIQTSFENTARMPSKANVDLQFYKDFDLLGQTFSIYLKVYNVLDTKNEINVYRDTGRAGYSLVSRYTPEYQGANTLTEYLSNPSYYSEPRRIILGIDYNLNF
ncbi:MAG: TonB-dependent receptor [Melioribacteraceae bacterium]|nr:TonB-dependent receptor [Melioribacteraceae bacterium]MCF8356534.1 TonB-dependent receptor [Melioribacteraceae bacterium]MCF8393272.1 TonB-dependent receptor [Melioribacteraceae bacterium]MCF8417573.1 TonB-dependent receptor [Melioribacteraceae bacterium]